MFQIATTSCTQTAELLILMICPAWLHSISRHGSGNLWEGSVWVKCLVCVCVLSHSVMSNSLKPQGSLPASPLCPWDFPGKNTGVNCHLHLQGIFWTQRWNPFALQADYLPLSHWDSMDTLEYMFLNCCMLYYHFSGPLNDFFENFAQVFVVGGGVACLEEFFAQLSWQFFLSLTPKPHNIALCCIFIRQLFCLRNHPWSKALEFWKITHFGS